MVRAQQPINASNAATMPSPGTFLLEEQFHFESLKLEHGPAQRQGRIRDYGLFSNLNLGLVRDVSLSLRVPVLWRDRDARAGGGTDLGVGDVTILGKWRFWKNDTSALNTQRLALTGGVDIPSGDNPFTGNSCNPIVGLAYTQIAGRNGINAALQYTFTTNGSDGTDSAGRKPRRPAALRRGLPVSARPGRIHGRDRGRLVRGAGVERLL